MCDDYVGDDRSKLGRFMFNIKRLGMGNAQAFLNYFEKVRNRHALILVKLNSSRQSTIIENLPTTNQMFLRLSESRRARVITHFLRDKKKACELLILYCLLGDRNITRYNSTSNNKVMFKIDNDYYYIRFLVVV